MGYQEANKDCSCIPSTAGVNYIAEVLSSNSSGTGSVGAPERDHFQVCFTSRTKTKTKIPKQTRQEKIKNVLQTKAARQKGALAQH